MSWFIELTRQTTTTAQELEQLSRLSCCLVPTKIDCCIDKLINGDMLHSPNYQFDEDLSLNPKFDISIIIIIIIITITMIIEYLIIILIIVFKKLIFICNRAPPPLHCRPAPAAVDACWAAVAQAAV
jgi:hypothetical protein